MPPIYLDYNASTPVATEVFESMRPFLTVNFGNASSSHAYGRQCHSAIARAREQVADLLGCAPEEIIFTSGGSEANNLAIKGFLEAYPEAGNHLVTTAIEHPAVSEACRYWQRRRGYRVTFVPVDEHGRVRLPELEAALTPQTALLSVMHANNEVGTLQPLADIAALARRHNLVLHCDAAQSVGKVPVKMNALGVDMLSLAGHKLYAPLGAGGLVLRRSLQLEPLIHGAKQEQQRRAGTENVAGIVGLGQACELAGRDLAQNMARMHALRERLWQGLYSRIPELRRNGHPEHCLPNTLSVSFRGVQANTLLAEIGEQLAASAGAACHSADEIVISHVLQAMQVPREYAMGTLRLSVGRYTTEEEIDRAVTVLAAGVRKLRGT
ncbi:MAG: Cysteine desulfurase IscS [bacterium]|nr:Cysteine desulfurase IscS [bacterium]